MNMNIWEFIKMFLYDIGLTIKIHIVQILSAAGGLFTFLFVRFPMEMSGELFYRFLSGLISCIIYAFIAWWIKARLDKWHKKNNK